jgi:hypothetical protein
MSVSIDHTLKVLEVLSRCEPRKVRRTDVEARSQLIANGCLGFSFIFYSQTYCSYFFTMLSLHPWQPKYL